MSQVEGQCLFDNNKECPVLKASQIGGAVQPKPGGLTQDAAGGIKSGTVEGVTPGTARALSDTIRLDKACPICPIRLKMLP